MERSEVFNKIVEICRDVFDNDEVVYTESTSAANVVEWDSLTHLNLISDIEDEYGIHFTLDEITNSKNLGELLDALIKHINQRQEDFIK